MAEVITTDSSRKIIKQDWALDGYYDPAEKQLEIFWTNKFPFYDQFRRLALDNTIELACGHGRHTAQILDDKKRFTLVDINEGNIAYCKARFLGRENVTYLVNSGSELRPLEDNRYTSLFCYDAMVHFELEDVISYLYETYRVLMPGGQALFHFSNYDKAPGGLYHDNPHWRNFNSALIFRHFATRTGFEILHLQTLNWGADIDLDGLALLRKP